MLTRVRVKSKNKVTRVGMTSLLRHSLPYRQRPRPANSATFALPHRQRKRGF